MTSDYFSATYSDARGKFLSACLQAGMPVTSFRNPLSGPLGESLYTDVTRIGPSQSERVLFVVSATHGVEGFCGSGIQVGLLLDNAICQQLTENVALVLIHSINPYGFAWIRRVNEDNVDLNRNFVDHAGGNYPENDLFEEIVDGLLPEVWDDASVQHCQSIIDAAIARHGEVAVSKSTRKGQYRHPRSMHFGGTHATWSNQMLHQICRDHLQGATSAALIDVHSGLGPYGYGELMTPSKPGEAVFDRFHSWYGDEVHSTTAGKSNYAGSRGSILAGFNPADSSVNWGSVGVEYGTRPSDQVRTAVRRDHWLDLYGELDSEEGKSIKRTLRDAFYPDEDEWKAKVWERGREITAIALERLAEE